jgi:hypothetical protein
MFSLHGVHVLECPPDGKKLRTERDAVDLIGEAISHQAGLILIPAERLEDDFFQLRTRGAGEMIQKFVNYRIRVAILGDISRHLDESSALRAFVSESNRGDQVWFVSDLDELNQRLERAADSTR